MANRQQKWLSFVYIAIGALSFSVLWNDFSSLFKSPSNHKDELLFFNVPQQSIFSKSPNTLLPLSSANYKKGGPVIATLVTNSTKDVSDLQTALNSLAFLNGDNPKKPAPVLVFNEGNLYKEQIKAIIDSTKRPIAFPLVDFSQFPIGFEPQYNGPEFLVRNRRPWGYYQMIRFWMTGIWKHPALEDFEIIMRIDSDSCFKSKNPHLPYFAKDDLVYHSQYAGFEVGGETFIHGLYDFAAQYANVHSIRIQNPLLWQFITTTWESRRTLPLYNTNFELSRKSFMQRKDVMDFHEALTEKKPFGVLTHRWGDAVTRMITSALFADDTMIMQSAPLGYHHKDRCSLEEVKEALIANYKLIK